MKGFKQAGGKYISLLFVVLLFFSLTLCSLFTVLIGAQVYENINGRMEDNFREQTALSYISNKVKQADRAGAVSLRTVEGTQVLALEQVFDGTTYETLIYYMDGQIRELFSERGVGLGLEDGIEILPSEGLTFAAVNDKLIQVTLKDAAGGTIFLGLRSEVEANE